MTKRIWVPVVAGICFVDTLCFGYTMLEDDKYIFCINSYFRMDSIALKNSVDLDSANSDDTSTYLGLDYSLGFNLEYKNNGPKFYLKLERNGPFDYDAPLFVHNTLMTSGGVIEKYRNEELLPQTEEFWVDSRFFKTARFKVGLYSYEVANAFSLSGSYENYGFTVYQEIKNLAWRFYYCRPDYAYKNRLGPRIRQEEEQGIGYEHNAANFFALDTKFNLGNNYLWPYLGVLADYTSPGKRDNAFSAPIKKDLLGTLGVSWTLKQDKLQLNIEMAHNFGKATSSDPEFKDVYHTGYLIYTDLDYRVGKFLPTFQFLVTSGNKATLEMAQNEDTYLTSGKNRAFSVYSPLNNNLADSVGHNNTSMRPIVATGACYGIQYGVPRPGAFSSTDLDNLIMPSLGFDFQATDKLCLGLYGYYLRAFERGVGKLNDEARFLSRDLGYEFDAFIDYQLTKHTLISLEGGYFIPGRFYKEERDDASGSLLTPFVRGDQKADPAYQIELSLELQF